MPTDGARARILLLALLAMAGAVSCRQDMHDQPKYQTLEASDFFADGRASRAPIPGTVARGQLRLDAHLHAGRIGDAFARGLPMALTPELLERGRQRFDIFCSPCHGRVGDGRGMAVRRGIAPPPSFHIDRLRDVEEGYLFDVISNGFGRMYGYGAQIRVEDRWAIVAYLRALQLSQNARPSDLPPGRLPDLEGPGGRP